MVWFDSFIKVTLNALTETLIPFKSKSDKGFLFLPTLDYE